MPPPSYGAREGGGNSGGTPIDGFARSHPPPAPSLQHERVSYTADPTHGRPPPAALSAVFEAFCISRRAPDPSPGIRRLEPVAWNPSPSPYSADTYPSNKWRITISVPRVEFGSLTLPRFLVTKYRPSFYRSRPPAGYRNPCAAREIPLLLRPVRVAALRYADNNRATRRFGSITRTRARFSWWKPMVSR